MLDIKVVTCLHLKPYWCDTLKEVNRDKKSTWKEWKDAEGTVDEIEKYLQYKDSKRRFSKAIYNAKKDYEIRNMEELTNSGEMDIGYFWKIVNKNKQKAKVLHPIKLEDGTLVTDPHELRNAWQKYFQNLYSPDIKDNYDTDFHKYVEEKLKEYINDSNVVLDDILQDDFTEEEIAHAVRSMKPNKAPGWDNVTAESIKHAGDKMTKVLTRLCNIIIKMEYIPWQFKIGLLIPIPKGDKNKSYQDNYRGITLLPVIAKIVEKCFMKRIGKWAKDKGIIIDIQGALQEKCSSMHSAWLVKESIAENLEKEIPSYIGLLDIQKAFDTIWQNGMFYKMHEAGIQGKTWRIMRLFYQDFICKVLLNGKSSDNIMVLRGIHQGAPCSMFYFALFLNDLLKRLQELYISNTLCGITLNCVAFADDITLIARCKTDLQVLVDTAYEYSRKWRFRFHPEKCVILVFGKGTPRDINITLGGHRIKMSKSEPHLGNVLATTPSKEQEYINQRIDKCQNVCYASQSIGSKVVPVTPSVLSKLYHSACIPKLCYGVEIMDIDHKSAENMETFHAKNAKMFQGLSKNTCNIGSITTIGWPTISALIDIYRMLFMYRTLVLPMQCMYKVIMLKRITNQLFTPNAEVFRGPVSKMLMACQKYALQEIVLNAVLYGEYIEPIHWKKLVKELVYKVDSKRQKINIKLYKSMSLLNVEFVGSHIILPWWKYAKTCPWQVRKCRVITRLLLNSYRLGREMCIFCNDGSPNDIAHILFDCRKLHNVRKDSWANIEVHCPLQLWRELNGMCSLNRSRFLLNAFNCDLICEWSDLYMDVVNFVYIMFTSYQRDLCGGNVL